MRLWTLPAEAARWALSHERYTADTGVIPGSPDTQLQLLNLSSPLFLKLESTGWSRRQIGLNLIFAFYWIKLDVNRPTFVWEVLCTPGPVSREARLGGKHYQTQKRCIYLYRETLPFPMPSAAWTILSSVKLWSTKGATRYHISSPLHAFAVLTKSPNRKRGKEIKQDRPSKCRTGQLPPSLARGIIIIPSNQEKDKSQQTPNKQNSSWTQPQILIVNYLRATHCTEYLTPSDTGGNVQACPEGTHEGSVTQHKDVAATCLVWPHDLLPSLVLSRMEGLRERGEQKSGPGHPDSAFQGQK